MKCIVCKEEMKLKQDYVSNVLLEEYGKCSKGHYEYLYNTGKIKHTVGNQEIIESCTAGKEEYEQTQKELSLAVSNLNIN